MKAVRAIAALMGILALASCGQTCDCTRYCVYFEHHTVEVCRVQEYPSATPEDSARFQHAIDSLAALYGAPSDTVQPGMLQISGRGDAINSARAQIEQQGYHCICRSPK